MNSQVGAKKIATRRRVVWAIFFVAAASVVLAVHLYLLTQSWDTVSPLMLPDRIFDLGLTVLLAMGCTVGLGWRVAGAFGLEQEAIPLRLAFAFALGAGVFSLVLLALGALQILWSPVVLLAFGVLLCVGALQWREMWQVFAASRRARVPFTRLEKFLLAALLALALPVLLSALTPPIDSDALTYHLHAPAVFLRQGAILPLRDNIGANYPIAMDLMYLVGLAAGSDIMSQLWQFTFAGAITLAIYGFCCRRFSRTIALLACVIFWSSSTVGLEASTPMIDLAWSGYEFLAVLAFVLWREQGRARGLLLLGVLLGFAGSNKYLGLVGWALMVGLVAGASGYDAWRMGASGRIRRVTLALARNGALVVGAAVLVAAPWYLKNALAFGNPFYPFFTGAYSWDGALRRDTGDPGTWVGYGLGNDFYALALFPYNIYFRWQYFGIGFNRGGPTLFFWLLPLYLVVRKVSALNWFFFIAGLRFAFWFLYAQNVRYLLLIYPLLAIICSYTVGMLWLQWKRPVLRVGLGAFLAFCVVWGIFSQWGFLLVLRERAPEFLSGQISRNSFLAANLSGYRAIQFQNQFLPENARIFAIGEQRLYYSQRDTITDAAHDNWHRLTRMGSDADAIAQVLFSLGVTHVWVSEDDLLYVEQNWKVESPLNTALFQEFRTGHLKLLYTNGEGHTIYRLE